MKIKTNVRAGAVSLGKQPITCTGRHVSLF